jgi:hypothetical protein
MEKGLTCMYVLCLVSTFRRPSARPPVRPSVSGRESLEKERRRKKKVGRFTQEEEMGVSR